MKRLLLIAPLALAACDVASDNPKTPEQAAAAVSEAVKMKPGNWRTTMQVTKMDMPGAPPQAAEMMKGAMQVTTSDSCVTKADAEADPKDFLKKNQDGDCTYETFDMAGGKIDATMVCKPKQGGETRAKMAGLMTPESMNMTMDMTVSNADLPGGKMEMAMKMDAKRIGDCS